MSSGSEDEFFDAPENISYARSRSVVSQKQDHAESDNDVFGTPVSKLTNFHLNDDAELPQNDIKSQCIETVSNEPNLSKLPDGINANDESSFIKEPKSSESLENSSTECESGSKQSLSNKEAVTTKDYQIETVIDDNAAISTDSENALICKEDNIKVNDNSNNDNCHLKMKTEILPNTPEGPAPVAPPRKKRHTKKEAKPKELILESAWRRNQNVLLKTSDNTSETDPCIEVKASTNEMDRVLERGNSLEVVYNDDLMTRKSGGLSPVNAVKQLPVKSTCKKPSSIKELTSDSNDTQEQKDTNTSDINRPLTDAEILEQVIIKNLDTGETIPLSLAEEKLPECTNPLTLHIYRLATEQNSDEILPSEQGDEDGHLSDVSTASGGRMQGKRKKLKKFLGRTVQKIKSVADELQVRKADESSSSEDEQVEEDNGYIKFKHHRMKKERLMFDRIKLLQDLSGEHIGAVWTMKFSLCGKLLATAGQDNIVRVWVLKDAAHNFEEMRRKYSRPMGRTSPTGSMTSSNSATSAEDDLQIDLALHADDSDDGPFRSHPFVRYHGHTSDVLDLSWSKNYFLLSSSMDKTVRLWHISRQECLCCFQHVDFVTAICFHPRDDRYFLSGSLDGKIRLWNIPEKKVALWNEIDGYGTSLVTAANFCQNGKLAVIGTYDGRCIFYDTEKLKYHTQVTVRSSRGKNARGRKISGIEPMPGEDKVLITSNDSRIRLYDLKDHSLYCKYKGLQNESSQIRATFSHDGKLILCGSEDKYVYIWRANHDLVNVRKDRNEYYESFSAHDAVVTAAIFAPYPNTIIEKPNCDSKNSLSAMDSIREHSSKPYEIIVAADWQGGVKLYINR